MVTKKKLCSLYCNKNTLASSTSIDYASEASHNKNDASDYENDGDDNDDENSISTPTELLHHAIIKQLTDAGLVDYLTFEKSQQAITTFLNRVATFIVWASNKEDSCSTAQPISIDAMSIIYKFITVNYQIVGEFCSYLRDVMFFEYSTVSNWIFDIKKACEWFAVFRTDRHTNFITSASNNTHISII